MLCYGTLWVLLVVIGRIEGFVRCFSQASRTQFSQQQSQNAINSRLIRIQRPISMMEVGSEYDDKERASIDQAMVELFRNQIYEDFVVERPFQHHFKKSSQSTQSKTLVERATPLFPEVPLEFVEKGKLRFGNFVDVKGDSMAILVRLSSGSVVTIDKAQIISVWDEVADDREPTTPEDWAEVTREAMEILRATSPRKSKLDEFWKILLAQRSRAVPTDSLDLGVYVFQERKFRKWIGAEDDVGEAARIYVLSAAQRMAVSLLLFNDELHFKRRPSVHAWPEDSVDESNQQDVGEIAPSYVIEGGYKVLDMGVVQHREWDIFQKYYEHRVQKVAKGGEGDGGNASEESEKGYEEVSFRTALITRFLRAMEIFSMSLQDSPPPAVRGILKRLGQPLSPAGARAVLMAMGHTSQASSPIFRQFQRRTTTTTVDKDGVSTTIVGPIMSSDDLPLVLNITPWSPDVLAEAQTLAKEVAKRRQQLERTTPPNAAGKRGPHGLIDYRSSRKQHPVICLDNANAAFLDDAFSISPETGEILIYVTDVVQAIKHAPMLQACAKERIASTYLPTGPLHMLPPAALDALRLSTQSVNEVIAVAAEIDFHTGDILATRVFPALIGPVIRVDVNTANELLAGIGSEIDSKHHQVKSKIAGLDDNVVRDLRQSHALVRRILRAFPFIDEAMTKKRIVVRKYDRRTGVVEENVRSYGAQSANDFNESGEQDGAERIVNTLLSIYSNVTYQYVHKVHQMPVPIAFENRDKTRTDFIRRFASQPLRHWLAQQQQQQIRAALQMDAPLSREACALAVSHHKLKRSQLSELVGAGRTSAVAVFDEFEAYCAQEQARLDASGQRLVLQAEGTGRGGQVRVLPFNVPAIVPALTLGYGEKVEVHVKKLLASSRTVILEPVL